MDDRSSLPPSPAPGDEDRHRVATDLAVIRGRAQLLLRRLDQQQWATAGDNAQWRHDLEVILQAVDRLAARNCRR
jgi:hypothetical protein